MVVFQLCVVFVVVFTITIVYLIILRVFFFVLILASLSTLIDLIKDQVIPGEFGTQHIAILLVAWCPAIVFGSSASILKSDRFINVPQVIFRVFATRSYLSTAAPSARSFHPTMYTFFTRTVPCTP
jgi:hypothetical protein